MKKKRGFKLKSGNNLGAKGRKPSNFKMMGASPARQDVTVAEKFRKVTEAYQIENDYGRTIETYKDTLEVDGAFLELDFLRIGRISLMYQSVDGKVSGVWNQETQSWEDASDQRNQIKLGLSIAKKQVPPDLVILPVDSPEAA